MRDFVVVLGVSRFGLAIRPSGAGMQEDLGSIPLRLFSLQKVWFMDTVFVTLPLTVNETLFKMALTTAHLNARVILVVTAMRWV